MTILTLLLGVHIIAVNSLGQFDSLPQNSLQFTAEEIVGHIEDKIVYRSLKGEVLYFLFSNQKSHHSFFEVMLNSPIFDEAQQQSA